MTENIKSVNLLPEFLRSTKNSKFLATTIDQFIQKPQLERIDGYVGSTNTPNYNTATDIYISESLPLRRDYQLDPALVVKDASGNVNDVVALDDLINEISRQGGLTDNLDRLFRTKFYSYNPHIDWDKLINYQQYYWMPTGPETVDVDGIVELAINIDLEILGQKSYTSPSGVIFSNGMKIRFGKNVIPASYADKEYFIEGVGTSITLTDYTSLVGSEVIANTFNENFDATPFDDYPFDTFKKLPLVPEYVTINRASIDLNPWSRYNRWVHKDVILASASYTGQNISLPADMQAKRPIIEFVANLKLYNFGSTGISNVDFVDTETTDAFSLVEGSAGHHVDGTLLEQGHRVIFTADTDSTVRGNIYEVSYITLANKLRLTLKLVASPENGAVTAVNHGKTYAGTSWWFNGDAWKYAQQHKTLNQAPLFDLFDETGYSYSDPTYYTTNFKGNKIFGYEDGTIYDSVLGLNLKYRNSVGIGSYLFKNYFMTDSISITQNNQITSVVSTGVTFCKINDSFNNVWVDTDEYPIPVLTSQLTTVTSEISYYDTPLGLSNNPLNGPITDFTLSEISDHVSSMVSRSKEFAGSFPGNNNLRDISNISNLGTRFITNVNPMAFAHFFIGKQEHNVVDALTKAADQYNDFKMAFLKKISDMNIQDDPVIAVDLALKEINADKSLLSPYYLSDMVAYGTDKIVRTWTITDSRNKTYPITTDFYPTDSAWNLSHRSVLVYLNGKQLSYNHDYDFVKNDALVELLIPVKPGDVLVINDYADTRGNFIPPTPTKLGMYPKSLPFIYTDGSFASGPKNVIRGHDGSRLIAYNDYRDTIILELEKRIYNNIKAEYNPELFDINSVLPGAWRDTGYSREDITDLTRKDFIKWVGRYGIDYTTNTEFDEGDPFTWNYKGSYNAGQEILLNGSWRNIYNYFYDTDIPQYSPWEMLGFIEQPLWWKSQYGSSPYTSGNLMLWQDLEQGIIRQGDRAGKYSLYARPGLLNYIPVDENGKLIDPTVLLAKNITPFNKRQPWIYGDYGAAESAWRRSSYWPFVVQKIMALARPASYSALMYDPIRTYKNIAGQWNYLPDHSFLNLKNVKVYSDGDTVTSGYSVYVTEVGKQRTGMYVSELKSDLANLDFNLFYKVGGFVSKDKLQVIIDAYEPTSTSPGAIMPPEDYNLILNVSNPIKTTAISGIIVQKDNGNLRVKGYDTGAPYFTIYKAIRTADTPVITVGGISESYITWAPSSTIGGSGLSAADTTTANSAVAGIFYQQGQLVKYGNTFYRVTTSHRSGDSFVSSYFQQMPYLPTVGGATVQTVSRFDKTVTIQIPYDTEFNTIQEVYDVIVGYGAWLEDQGFIFDEYNSDLMAVVNWDFTSREFLYWTTQNWADQNVIALSPFADQIKFKLANSVVDNIFNSFYEYSLLKANAVPFPQSGLTVNREDGLCTIKTLNKVDGIYFAKLNSVQKEHALVFNNKTMFNDLIFDIETGYRQHRMRLKGFRTANWDGDYFSPGFVYDTATISNWTTYTDYLYGDVVRFNSNYYSANNNVKGSDKFDFAQWTALGSKPVAQLLPNFDYKINQFEDFYSLDIDNFDSAEQKMAQHLTGYTPRVYLNNIFTDPIAQYKFYQGFIREKGTKNSIRKLAKATIHNLQGQIDYNEEWAFRVGYYGSYETYREIEVPLVEGTFVENPQIINFVNSPPQQPNDLIVYNTPGSLSISPTGYLSTASFAVVPNTDAFQISTAGYVRFDDIDYTAYNINSVLNFTGTGYLSEGSTIWLGSKDNSDWDVLKYTLDRARVLNMTVEVATVGALYFETDVTHGLSTGDVIAINEFDATVDGIYKVSEVISLNQFSVINTSSVAMSAISPADPGLLFKFTSSRYPTFDSFPSDTYLLSLAENTKLWVDNDGNDKWAVYQKTKNYSDLTVLSPQVPLHQKMGWNISKKKDTGVFLVSSPGYNESPNIGNVSLYVETPYNAQLRFRYGINRDLNHTYYTYSATNDTGFGWALAYDETDFISLDNTGKPISTGYGLLFAGAPMVSNIKSNDAGPIRYADITATPSTRTQEGLVKISSVDRTLVEEVTQRVLLSPEPSTYERFGSSIYQANFSTGKLLLVGAPQTNTIGTGTVYSYWVTTSTVNTGTINIAYNGKLSTSTIKISDVGSQWGTTISGSKTAEIIAIGAPGYSVGTGLVTVYSGIGTNHVPQYLQTLYSPFDKNSRFGDSISVSQDGSYIFVAAPDARGSDQSYGKVAVYTKVGSAFTLTQIINNPVAGVGMKFGRAVDVNPKADELVISAIGTNRHVTETFDKYSLLLGLQPDTSSPYVNDPYSTPRDTDTTFDLGSTTFFDTITYSGTAYVYNRKDTVFRLADELLPIDTNTGTNFGFSLSVNENSIYVGAPAYKNKADPDLATSAFYQFYKKDTTIQSWNKLRTQDDLVSVDAIQKVSLIDVSSEEVIDYLDILDPLKGKISGVAEQEIKYRSSVDPAIYSIGTSITVNDPGTNWLDSHVGELWWDLSTVKYSWYEQGDLEYRKNNWGKIFPGSSIDVYEWVGSTLLPSQWAAIADTTEGLTQGVSGQPKNPDNSVISVKQIYNSVNDSFSNYYYYWVKNKLVVPTSKNRRINAYQVADLISNPTSYGLRYAAIIAKDAVIIANAGNLLVKDNVHLNVSADAINNAIPRHTEWLLLQEGSANSRPNTLLEKKLIDSLLGHDSLGNPVPDPSLSKRSRYGISIRPRQTMFKDRLAAIRNIVEFSNSVLINERITGNFNFDNLNAQELPPDQYSHSYDQIAEDNEALLLIDTRQLATAQLSAVVANGKVVAVNIDDPGFGYKISPKVTVVDGGNTSAVITTTIDAVGRVTSVTIENAGSGFTTAPSLIVRPYTVVVLADVDYNGKWTEFIYNTSSGTWVRAHTQQYNATLYWNYVDWAGSTYNKFLDYAYTIDELYQLNELETLTAGDYVKVNNAGLGYYVILEKTAAGVVGNFDTDFNIVYAEKGTIQISNDIWDFANSNYGYDENAAYDQTLYDQKPDIELEYILTALKNDLFVNELKVNWNLLFFKSVKYALSEQKLLDWAFKTSFINVVNYAGGLDQRKVYKLQDSQYYEDYINEVKPYHTKIRSFTTNHTILEPTASYVTDFDLPAYYNRDDNKFETVNLGNTLTNVYPWKAWADNYLYHVNSISIGIPGSGYTSVPQVKLVTQDGDTGSGATAIAYIRSGQVSDIVVTNPGQGYKKSPLVEILGGGDTGLTPAVAYANLANNKVRSSTIGIKFDRTSRAEEAGNLTTVDTFSCNGSDYQFTLKWLAEADKTKISVTLDGELVLSSDYTVKYYNEAYGPYGEYTKKYSEVVFLNYVPSYGQILEVTYQKNSSILNAVDRITNYYTATSGMPGLDLGQLMTGIQYPKTQIQGLRFDYTTNWDTELGYDLGVWDDGVGFYTNTLSTSSYDVGGTWTSIGLVDVTGIALGQSVNVASTSTPAFSSSLVKVVNVDSSNKVITVNATTASIIPKGSLIELWSYSSNSAALDSNIIGGTWAGQINVDALGINPEDITIDGDRFISPNVTHAPEELVPGEIVESLGVNVYTKNPHGSPVILSSYFTIEQGTTSTRTLSLVPPNYSSINVSFENTIFEYSTTTDFTTSTQFAINWQTNELIVPPQPTGGQLGYTIVSIGGGRPDTEAGVIDSAFIISSATSVQIQSLSSIDTVKSAYVTVNGQSILPLSTDLSITATNIVSTVTTGFNVLTVTTSTFDYIAVGDFAISATGIPAGTTVTSYSTLTNTVVLANSLTADLPAGTNVLFTRTNNYGYVLTNTDNINRRASVDVYNLPEGTNTVTAWFFGNNHKYFNEIREQIIVINTGTLVNQYTEFPYDLIQPPGNVEPQVANALVEFLTYKTNGRRLLVPPHINYYQVSDDSNTLFKIDNNKSDGTTPNLDLSKVRTYVNGSELVRGFDYVVTQTGTSPYQVYYIQINPGLVKKDDVVAVLSKPGYINNNDEQNYEYDIQGSKLLLCEPPSGYGYFGWKPRLNIGQIKVITYTDHDDMLVRTEVFNGNPSGRYKISRPVLNENYIWIYHNGIPLVNFVDFEILEDQVTVQVADYIIFDPTDTVEIISFSNNHLASTVLGYRIFNDIFNRTHFKRLSKQNTTYLTQPLSFTDTEIHVADSHVLTYPQPDKNIPGVIIIDGERIEFFVINGNVLSQLRRSTLGTAPKFYNDVNTKVIDQSPDQNVPFGETILVQNKLTTTATVYVIDTTDHINDYNLDTPNPGKFINNGIVLSTTIDAVDQVSVYYGGRRLNKVGTYHQDINFSYDSPVITSIDFTTSTQALPYTTILGTAYVVTTTNQVWVYEDSKDTTAANGYQYRGLNYQPPEFSINTSTQEISLNIPEGVQAGIKLTVVKKQFASDDVWNTVVTHNQTTKSLMDSDTIPAKFLQARPAELPDRYYYGGDPTLVDDSGFAVIDDKGGTIEGY